MNLCPIDQKPLEGKQKYCSDKCRKQAQRIKPEVLEGVVVETAKDSGDRGHKFGAEPLDSKKSFPLDSPRSLSETDKLFDEFRPDFYNFAEEELKAECQTCSKSFTSHLASLRFCSPDCQQRMLRALSGQEKLSDGPGAREVRPKKG